MVEQSRVEQQADVLPHVQPAAPKEHFDRAEKPQWNVFRFSKSYLQGASGARNKEGGPTDREDRDSGRKE